MLLSSSQSNRLMWPSVTVGQQVLAPRLLTPLLSAHCPIRSRRAKRPHKQKLKIQYARLGKAHNQKDARKSCLDFLLKFSPIQCDPAPSRPLQA